MALTFQQQYVLAVDTDFRRRVAMAAVQVAKAVAGEATTIQNHPNRVVLMKQVLMDVDAWAGRMAVGCVALGADQATTDAQLQALVGLLWDPFAGLA